MGAVESQWGGYTATFLATQKGGKELPVERKFDLVYECSSRKMTMIRKDKITDEVIDKQTVKNIKKLTVIVNADTKTIVATTGRIWGTTYTLQDVTMFNVIGKLEGRFASELSRLVTVDPSPKRRPQSAARSANSAATRGQSRRTCTSKSTTRDPISVTEIIKFVKWPRVAKERKEAEERERVLKGRLERKRLKRERKTAAKERKVAAKERKRKAAENRARQERVRERERKQAQDARKERERKELERTERARVANVQAERARQKKHLSDWSAQETKKREAKEAKERKQARGRPVDRASRGRIKKPPKYWKAISDYWKADNARRRGDQKTPTRDWEEALVDFGRRHEAAKKQPLQH